VKPVKTFSILYLPIMISGDRISSPTCTAMNRFSNGSNSYILATYPISENNFISTTSCIPHIFTASDGTMVDTNNDVSRLIYEIDVAAFWSGHDKGVGVVRTDFFPELAGENSIGAALGGSKLDQCIRGLCDGVIIPQEQTDGVAAAHEIAHTYGWVTGPLDIGGGGHTIGLPAEGFWIDRHLNMSTGLEIDFMNSRKPSKPWISAATWNYLLDRLKDNPDPKVIFIRGMISKNDTAVLDPWYRSDGSVDLPLNNTGDYHILYFNRDGMEIGQTGLDLGFSLDSHTGVPLGLNSAFLSMKIPDLDGTSKIILEHNGKTLAERTISPNAPEIELTSPKSPQEFVAGEKIPIVWNSSDVDGDRLVHVVLISNNDGESWIPLTSEITENKFTFDSTPLNRTGAILVKVIVSDGVNTAEALSKFFITENQQQNQGASVSIVSGASSLTDTAFQPNPVQVSVGDTVTWTNDDTQPHTVVSGSNGTPDGKFDSSPNFNPLIAPGQTFEHTFTEAGEYPYYCALHPNMVGTVSVTSIGIIIPQIPRTPTFPAQPSNS